MNILLSFIEEITIVVQNLFMTLFFDPLFFIFFTFFRILIPNDCFGCI